MNKKIITWSIAVGLGGLLFGMDVAVISGAEKTIQQLWGLSDWVHGVAIAMALFGTSIGAAFGNIPANRIGRKKSLIWIGILFFVSSVGAALAPEVISFMFFRFVSGLSIGASSVVAPVYISEIAPAKYRGRLVISFQMNIVAGILLAYLSNYLLQGVGGENDWRWMLGIVAFPSLLFSLFMVSVPETPRWLLLFKNDEVQARKVLSITEDDPDKTIRELKAASTLRSEPLFNKKFYKPLLLAFLLATFNQLSGINAIIYFAPRVFEMAHIEKSSAFLSTVGIGVINLFFTVLGWSLIDKFGRRTLMFIGSLGYIVSLALIAWSFHTGSGSFIVYYVFLFIAAHAVGQGAVIWVFIAEIFPNSVRAAGTSFGSLTHWAWATMITLVFPSFAGNPHIGGAKIFAFFAGMMVLQLLYVWKMMPETKGVALEDMDKKTIVHV